MEYTAPDIARDFTCKCGACRASCCRGWPVIINKAEYRRLLEADCAPDFREKLGEAMRLLVGGNETSCAALVGGTNDACRLQRADGLCELQLTMGEAALPSVCRLYPRSLRALAGNREYALAASCEGVAELLLASGAPLTFVSLELPAAPYSQLDMTEAQYGECRAALALIGDRRQPLRARFDELGQAMFGVDPASAPGETRVMARSLALLRRYSGKNQVAGDVCRRALAYYGFTGKAAPTAEEAETALARQREGHALLRALLPDWEAAYERLLVNHMFYNDFPHVGGSSDGDAAFYSLCAIADFLLAALCGTVTQDSGRETLADTVSTLFRLIEHSDFKYRALALYREYR